MKTGCCQGVETIGVLSLMFCCTFVWCQVIITPKIFRIKGYVKDLPYVQFDKHLVYAYPTNLMHNRLNFSFNPGEQFNAALEIRTRLYWGDEVRLTPNFANHLSNSNEQVKASVRWFETTNAALHSNIERLWINYRVKKWDIRFGRQRINWSTASIWNPNDLFNTYNFIDFDYEERPGSDALRIHHTFKELSYAEAALSIGKTHDKNVAALRYFFNRNGFDGQLNAGIFRGSYTAGAAWAGSIKQVGFKGEVQYFAAHQSEKQQVNIVAEWDYIGKKQGYWAAGILYNSQGLKQPVSDWQMVNLSLSPRNPMPTSINVLLTVNREFSPLINASLSLVMAPQTHILFFLPSVNYSISDQLDMNFVWQSFFAESNHVFGAISHRAFLRLKWSF